jgi:hypothetical protein
MFIAGVKKLFDMLYDLEISEGPRRFISRNLILCFVLLFLFNLTVISSSKEAARTQNYLLNYDY